MLVKIIGDGQRNVEMNSRHWFRASVHKNSISFVLQVEVISSQTSMKGSQRPGACHTF